MSTVEIEIAWFKRLLNYRMLLEYDKAQWPEKLKSLPPEEASILLSANGITDIPVPEVSTANDPYAHIIRTYELNGWERAVLMLALLPHLQPEVLDVFITKENRTEYGGIKGTVHKGFLPTLQTVLYLIGGSDLTERFSLLQLFSESHVFRKANILSLEPAEKKEPELSSALVPAKEVVDFMTRGFIRPPEYSNDFPAKKVTTPMDWDDLILSTVTKKQIEEIKVWMRHHERLESELGMGKRLKRGYKILFHGSPGTGKTLTACLLGKYTGQSVFRIDLSTIVSKYIGETEKNLAKIFDKADNANWILFFDEADALFGSRTKVSNAHDRYANQEVSYLLQRIEDYSGIVILATNMKGNIDDAFMRRFSSVVHFNFPRAEERRLLWEKAFPEKLRFSDEIDIRKISDKYELSGAHISNVIEWCALTALDNGNNLVTESMLREGMAREMAKEGRTI